MNHVVIKKNVVLWLIQKIKNGFTIGIKYLLVASHLQWQKDLKKELAIDTAAQANTDNPYVAARQEWNLMFGSLIKAKYNWQRIAFLALGTNVILMIGLLWLAGHSRYIPYAVKVDALGNSSFAGFLTQESNLSPLQLNAFLRRYMTNARSVIADPVAQKQALDFVYASSTETTAKVLNEFYQQNSPFKTAEQATIEVRVNAVLQKSDKTWQVAWTEVQRDLEGKVMANSHWEALITLGQHSVQDPAILNLNPFGLFVEHISWTQQF